ncbi:maleylpyruvate isomerase [Agrobacterium vitis]|nr:maleylpyruvate isomerase [Agrobacterium vitis]
MPPLWNGWALPAPRWKIHLLEREATMALSLEESRRELQERQGLGARYDALQAPHADLALARLGAAYFARKLNEMSDADLALPSRVAGWSRRHVVAHVAYQARGLARLVEAARKGREAERLEEPEAQIEEVDFGASLPAHALRYLFHHAQIHLNVEWRDLQDAGWRASIESLQGRLVPIRETPWIRARAIWQAAVQLDNGASSHHFPQALSQRLGAEANADALSS